MTSQPEPRRNSPGDANPSAPLPWSNDAQDPAHAQDPDSVAIGEGWAALGQLIQTAELTRFGAAAQAKLIEAVRARTRRRAIIGWGLALTAAAAALVMLSIYRGDSEPIAGVAPPPNKSGPNVPHIAPNSIATNPSPVVPSMPIVPPAARSPAAELAAEFWNDDFADLESARLQAREVELSWRRTSEPPALLQQRFDELQADWNDRSL